VDGALHTDEAARLAHLVKEALQRTRDRLVLDLKRMTHLEGESAQRLAEALHDYRERIRILTPATVVPPSVAAALAVFSLYNGPGFSL
jgi:signal transduction histidine kinase